MARVSQKSDGCIPPRGCSCQHANVVPHTERTLHTNIHSHEHRTHTHKNTNDDDVVEIEEELDTTRILEEIEQLLLPASSHSRKQREKKEEDALIASDRCEANSHGASRAGLGQKCSESSEEKGSERECYNDIVDSRQTSVRYVGTQFGWRDSTRELREQVRSLLDTDIMNMKEVRRIKHGSSTYEHRSNTDDYHGYVEPVKVYQMHGLSLYCDAVFMNMRISCLTDCGAGVNLISKRVIGELMRQGGKHVAENIELLNERLVVSVANEKRWTLKQKAIIKFKVGGQDFRQTFWVTEKIEEDVFFGIPALREMSASIDIAHYGEKKGDFLRLRKTNTRVPLHHRPSGMTTGVLALSTRKAFTIPPWSGVRQTLVLRPGKGFVWPDDTPVQGLVHPAPRGEGLHYAKPVLSSNTIDPLTNETEVLLQNNTSEPVTYYPGCTVANLEPKILRTETDKDGNDFLYLGMDDKFHRKIESYNPNLVGGYACMETPLPAFPIPLAVVSKVTVEGHVTETVAPISDRALLALVRNSAYPDMDALEQDVDDKVCLPDTPAYAYTDCNVNEDLDDEQRGIVLDFLERNKIFFSPITQSYPNPKMPAFATQIIKMKKGHMPFASRAYPMSQEKGIRMKEILDGQLRKGMISPSQSPYASPAFLVPKPGGKWRLVVDMRKLNKMVEKSTWPIPRIYEILDKLAGSHFFSTLDLVDGFHQCMLHEDSRKYTAFITAFGTYEYNTTPMGLITSPNHFQFVMQTILAGKTEETNSDRQRHGDHRHNTQKKQENLIGDFCFLYIDDLLVFSKTPDIRDHMTALGKVIDRLEQYGLRAKATKAHIAMTEVKFLGWMLNKEGRSANPEKTRAIDEIPVPKGRKSKSQLSSFLGLASFYRTLIDNFSKITASLYGLLKFRGSNIEQLWTAKHQEDWDELKLAFKSEPILVHPDYTQPFIVKTDCSKTHAGAILCQIRDGQEHVVEYASTKLNPTQKKWHLTHLEGFAIVWALRKWRRYLEGRSDTKVITDHKALLFIRHNQYSDASHKLIRWMTFIDTFDVKFEHRHDVDHGDCDALTRMYEGDPDIVWSPEDPTADWVFDLLADYLPAGTHIQCVDTGGPKGSTKFNEDFRGTLVQPEQIRHYPKTANTVVMAVPPSTRAIIKPLFEDLYELKCSWAVWCPLKVLHASYFREPDTQLIVVQGPVGYGCTRRGAPERGAWITHGLGLTENVFIRSTIRKNGPHFQRLSSSKLKVNQIRCVRSDWEAWAEEALRLTDPPMPDLEVVDVDSFIEREQNKVDFESLTDGFLKKFKKEVASVNTFKSSWDRLSQVGSANCSHRRIRPMEYTQTSIDMYSSFCRSYTTLSHPSVRAVTGKHVEGEMEENGMEEVERKFKTSNLVTKEIEKRRREIRDARDLSVQVDEVKNQATLKLDIKKLEDQEALLREGGFIEGDTLLPMTQRSIRYFQKKDAECVSIQRLLEGSDDNEVWANLNKGGVEQSYTVKDDTIFVQTRNNLKVDPVLLVPKQLRNHLMHAIHRCKMFCHPGQKRMYAILRKDFWWPNMEADVKGLVRGCLSCQRSKAVQPKQQGEAMVVVPDTPFSVVGVDICGPFPKSNKHDFRHIVVFVDHYSRWIRLVPIKEATTESIANAFLKSWVNDFGTPELLVSDSGSQFTSDIMTDMGLKLGIKMHAFPAESQWRNGKVERVNRYIKERLRIWKKKDYRQWPDLLPFIEMSHHFTTMPQYGLSPYEILFGMPHRIPFSSKQWTAHSQPEGASCLISMMHEKIHTIREDFQKKEEELVRNRLTKLNKARKNIAYEVGEKVIVFTKGTKGKLVCLWSDQATVVGKLNSSTYSVLYPDGSTRDISTQRLRKAAVQKQSKADALGPFTTDYPNFMEGESSGKAAELDLDLLDREVIRRKPVPRKSSYRRIDQQGLSSLDNANLSITFGQFVAYKVSEGWKIGQYLGDHPGVQKGSIRLRSMNVLSNDAMKKPRQAIWRYEWEARRGRNVVAPLGSEPHDKPSAKNTGGLTPLWATIPHTHIYCTVTLTRGRITSHSWRALSSHVSPNHMASIHRISIFYPG